MSSADEVDDWPRLPIIGRNEAAAQLVRERTGMLEQRTEVLEAQVRDLSRILRSMGEGVLAVDRAGIVVHANRAVVDFLDLDRSAVLGSHMFVAVPNAEACEMLDDVMRGESRMVRELVLERADKEQVFMLSCRPLRKAEHDDGEPEGAIMVVRDVTELRRLERARQDFFSNVSHELKTPVTAIRGAIETIIDDPQMAAEDRDRFLDSASRQSCRLSTLVTDLLALARLEEGERALQRTMISVSGLVGDVLAAADNHASNRGVVLSLVVESVEGAPSFELYADEEALNQAVTNLVDNAVAHSESGGSVQVFLSQDHGEIRICVQDDGPGIPSDALDRVFERFYRVDAARSRARGGTGIGLSIVKHVAQAHGGSVVVRSQIGVGSTFTLILPVSPSA